MTEDDGGSEPSMCPANRDVCSDIVSSPMDAYRNANGTALGVATSSASYTRARWAAASSMSVPVTSRRTGIASSIGIASRVARRRPRPASRVREPP